MRSKDESRKWSDALWNTDHRTKELLRKMQQLEQERDQARQALIKIRDVVMRGNKAKPLEKVKEAAGKVLSEELAEAQAKCAKMKSALVRIAHYPISEPMGGAMDMRDTAERALDER